MKSTLFVRPNLKLFVLGALAILCVQQLITSSQSQASGVTGPVVASAHIASEEDLRALLEEAVERPSPSVFLRLSQYFERRGDYRKAILYLRRAETVAQHEEATR
jgi:hypothetical protein